MYAALWRVLPGPTWARLTQVTVLAALVTVVLFTWVFPALTTWLSLVDVTVDRP